MSPAPVVSVVIPTRDRADHVLDAVASALGQQDVTVEVIVVDDGSTDHTPQLLAAIDDDRVRVVRQEPGQGVARARNLGIAQARGEWIAFLDDDDLWAPGKLRTQLDAAARVNGALAYGAAVVVDDRHAVLQLSAAPAAAGLGRDILARNVIPGGCSNLIARTELVRRVGGFDDRFSMMADWDLWIRLAQVAPAGGCDDVLVAYRRHDQTMVARGTIDCVPELDLILAKYRSLRRAHRVRLDQRSILRYFARAQRRGGHHRAAARIYLQAAKRTASATDLARALVVVMGEPAIGASRRLRPGSRDAAPIDPPGWLLETLDSA